VPLQTLALLSLLYCREASISKPLSFPEAT